MIKITRKEQQVLRNLKNLMAAEQLTVITDEMIANQSQDIILSLMRKEVLVPFEINYFEITKEQLQVQDDDPEVEQAWEEFRAVQGNGSMSELYNNTDKVKVSKANKNLEKVLFEKGRLTHLVSGSDHSWVTEGKVDIWKKKGWKEGSQAAVPTGL